MPGGDVVEGAALELGAGLEHGGEEPELALFDRHDERGGGRKRFVAYLEAIEGAMGNDLMACEEALEGVETSGISRCGEDVGLGFGGGGFLEGVEVE